MTYPASPPAVSRAPRPWLTREAGECAFPIDGEGMALRACCNPCGGDRYCRPHRAIMVCPFQGSVEELERNIFAFLETRQ